MATSKKRCAFCREYFPTESMIRVRLSYFCSREHARGKKTTSQKSLARTSCRRKAGELKSGPEAEWLARITKYANQHGAFPDKTRKYGFDRHHIRGRKFTHDKEQLGRWLVIPVLQEYHATGSSNEYNVTHYPGRFEERFGTQISMFLEMCAQIKNEDGCLPFEDNVMIAMKNLIG